MAKLTITNRLTGESITAEVSDEFDRWFGNVLLEFNPERYSFPFTSTTEDDDEVEMTLDGITFHLES